MTRRELLTLLALALLTTGCGDEGPRPLVRGQDTCAYCRMTIDDIRFGVLVLTDRGRLQTFDSIECAASWVNDQIPTHEPRSIWVANFADPSQWVDAKRAVFLQGSQIRSPMGRDLVAFSADADPDALQRAHGGTLTTWSAIQTLVASPQSAPAGSQTDAHRH